MLKQIVVKGEGEEIIYQIIQNLENGKSLENIEGIDYFEDGHGSVAVLLMWSIYLINSFIMYFKWKNETNKNYDAINVQHKF